MVPELATDRVGVEDPVGPVVHHHDELVPRGMPRDVEDDRPDVLPPRGHVKKISLQHGPARPVPRKPRQPQRLVGGQHVDGGARRCIHPRQHPRLGLGLMHHSQHGHTARPRVLGDGTRRREDGPARGVHEDRHGIGVRDLSRRPIREPRIGAAVVTGNHPDLLSGLRIEALEPPGAHLEDDLVATAGKGPLAAGPLELDRGTFTSADVDHHELAVGVPEPHTFAVPVRPGFHVFHMRRTADGQSQQQAKEAHSRSVAWGSSSAGRTSPCSPRVGFGRGSRFSCGWCWTARRR